MKNRVFAVVCAILATLSGLNRVLAADPAVAVLDEKVNKLSAQMDDLQFRYDKLQKDLDRANAELEEVRRAAGGVSPADLKALDDRISAIDAARLKDRQIIIDQIAKELASIKGGKGVSRSPAVDQGPVADDSKEHVVVKGENLTTIAKSYGVTVADLRKANNLSSNDLKVGQKLTIPK